MVRNLDLIFIQIIFKLSIFSIYFQRESNDSSIAFFCDIIKTASCRFWAYCLNIAFVITNQNNQINDVVSYKLRYHSRNELLAYMLILLDVSIFDLYLDHSTFVNNYYVDIFDKILRLSVLISEVANIVQVTIFLEEQLQF